MVAMSKCLYLHGIWRCAVASLGANPLVEVLLLCENSERKSFRRLRGTCVGVLAGWLRFGIKLFKRRVKAHQSRKVLHRVKFATSGGLLETLRNTYPGSRGYV